MDRRRRHGGRRPGAPVIAAALFARFASRDQFNFSARFAAGLRNQFGGHDIKPRTRS